MPKPIAHFVVNLIIVKDGFVLLEKDANDTWKFPGGHVEANEDPRETLIREAKEELGINIETVSALETFSDKTGIKFLPIPLTIYSYDVESDSSLNEPHKNIGMTFVCTTKDEPKALEGQTIKWYSNNELVTINAIEEVKKLAQKALILT